MVITSTIKTVDDEKAPLAQGEHSSSASTSAAGVRNYSSIGTTRPLNHSIVSTDSSHRTPHNYHLSHIVNRNLICTTAAPVQQQPTRKLSNFYKYFTNTSSETPCDLPVCTSRQCRLHTSTDGHYVVMQTMPHQDCCGVERIDEQQLVVVDSVQRPRRFSALTPMTDHQLARAMSLTRRATTQTRGRHACI
jgi:hypothetical protein